MMSSIAKFFKEYIFIIVFFILLTVFIFRSLLFNISTNLPDWNDYPFIIWTISQNVEHFQKGTISGFFDSNALYPFKGNLLFCELFLPQSLVAFILHLFTSNPVLVFNIIFFITIFLNIFASFFFWKKFNFSKYTTVFATLVTSFSPLIFLNSVHFQILSIWPMYFGLSYLFSEKLSKRNAIMLGIWTSILFVSSAYLTIFTIFLIFLWFLFKTWRIYKLRESFYPLLKFLLIFCIIFALLAGPFIYKFINIQKMYDIKREYWEYIVYSAQFTDYFFTAGYDSVIYNLTPFQKWNFFDKGNRGMFPGFVLVTLALVGLFTIRKKGKEYSVSFIFNLQRSFFALILLVGFIFSLGPRLNINGVYIGIPLPYNFVLKFNPFLQQLRVTHRWSILFYLGITYFAILGLNKLVKITKKENIVVAIFTTVYLLEVIPLNKVSEAKVYYPPVYGVIQENCKYSPKVLLEYPMTQDIKGANIVTNLSYRTQMLLASVKHKCNIINGYSTYIPKDYERYESELNNSVYIRDKKKFLSLIRQRKVDILKLNKSDIYKEKSQIIQDWLIMQENTKILFDNKNTVIFRLDLR